MGTELSKHIFDFYKGFKSGQTSGKSILRPWNFRVSFHDQHTFDRIKPYHIIDVSIPKYKYEKVTTYYGTIPKSFAKLAEGSPEFQIQFEDDDTGSVTHLIHHIQQQHIMDDNGSYKALREQNLGDVAIELFNNDGELLVTWHLRDVYFLDYDMSKLSYDTEEQLRYTVTFGCDIINTYSSKSSFSFIENFDVGSLAAGTTTNIPDVGSVSIVNVGSFI